MGATGVIAVAAPSQKGIGMLSELLNHGVATEPMPVLFFGHGSPMNAIEHNSYTRALTSLGGKLSRPHAILVVSAHWLTKGSTLVAEASLPRTIHDFGGFPAALYEIQYPAPGSPEVAKLVQQTIQRPPVQGDNGSWGLDHGSWAVLKFLFPKADIPVLQLSIDINEPPETHYQIGQQLAALRNRGVLIVGSGNIVHNLRLLRRESDAPAFEWAKEFDEWAKMKLEASDHSALMHDFLSTEAGKLSVPTMDHYYPLLYVLGASAKNDLLRFEYEGIQNGSVSMRSFSLGRG